MRVWASVVGLTLLAAVPQAQDVPLLTVLSRAALYTGRFADQIAGMIVEETYVQDVTQVTRFGYRASQRYRGAHHRDLKSLLLLVKPDGADSWMQFRDVYEVDGRKVRDRNDRLERLFVKPGKNSAQQVERIAKESARYNIGEVERTINLPILGLTILHPDAQPLFRFSVADRKPESTTGWDVPKLPQFQNTEGTLAVSFKEVATQTMIRTPDGRNLLSSGRLWIAPDTGEVRMTELRVDDYTLAAAIFVAYGKQEGIPLPVPVAMHERYENRLSKTQVEGLATYSDFRQFEVQVDEQIAPIAPIDPVVR